MTQIGSSTPTYDANGNVINDFLHTYTWDAYGRPVTIDGVGVTYDALGRMVEQNRSGTYSQMAYSTTGEKLQIMSGQSFQKQYVQLVGGSQVVIPSTGTAYYAHPDWLGSTRLASTSNRTVAGDVAYAPFGEPYAASGSLFLSFTGMNQDTTANDYDFPAREYGIQGRWPSPDPAGIAAADPTNPQSWNRYAYALNNPLTYTDPSGLGPQDCGDGGDCCDPGQAVCTSGGGPGSDPVDCSSGACSMQTNITVSAPPMDSPSLDSAQNPIDLTGLGFLISVTVWGDGGHTWFVPSPAFAGFNLTQASSEDYIKAISGATAPLNKLSNCAGQAAASQIPFHDKLGMNTPDMNDNTPLARADSALDAVDKAGIVAGQSERISNVLNTAELPNIAEKVAQYGPRFAEGAEFLGPAGTAVGVLNFAAQTRACYAKGGH